MRFLAREWDLIAMLTVLIPANCVSSPDRKRTCRADPFCELEKWNMELVSKLYLAAMVLSFANFIVVSGICALCLLF